ncbi:bifunctional diaminohydroxyphosphoribosylaminopyrimidine deaminase/5-amino-6-(5-phosphoribosylamino)uracil reductase RibD [Gammaproteobacteria bacterium]|nr:bifunctional diaminohydroxyphosphoribosylaminopyrimidine deaminase/5-amino-6-(5-phosphoribosylamino)uracil reductase RibD [Gammaproteobacteria bacterium]
MNDSDGHQKFMHHALKLAEKGMFSCKPNPRVGCVIVKNNKIVGEGWHRKPGEDHAEIIAIRQASEAARDATVYISLEPCTHEGRTPPCVDALVKAKVKEVVFSIIDSNPNVSGQSVGILEANGIKTTQGILEDEARDLNMGFHQRMVIGKPYVRTKIAASIDGRTALSNGKSQWITCKESRQDVQQWRARSCAVLTSSQTVLMDDPSMNVRLPDFDDDNQPSRIIVDSRLRTNGEEKIFSLRGESVVYTLMESFGEERDNLVRVDADNDHVSLTQVFNDMAIKEFNEILIEAGSQLNGALLQEDLVDEIIIYFAPCVLGNGSKGMFDLPIFSDLSDRFNFHFDSINQVGTDLRIILKK